MSVTLRPYQKKVVESIYKTEKRGIKRQLVVMGTGAGKSFTVTQVILDKVKDHKKVLILVDQEELVWQWKNYVHSMDDTIQIGVEKADHKAKKSDQVVIATTQTLGRKGIKRIKRFKPNHFSFCVGDEIHKAMAETWLRVLNYFGFGDKNFDDNNLFVGLTATPYRTDGVSLKSLFDDIVANYDIKYLMGEGWLTDIELHSIQTQTDLRKYKTQGEIDEAVNNQARNLEILKAYQQLENKDQFIGYTASVAHAYELSSLFNNAGIKTSVIEAGTDKDERKQIIEDYKNEEVDGIFNHSVLTTGTDLPETSMLMLLRPIQSKLTLTQTIGRGLRPSASAFIDVWTSKEERLQAIEFSQKSHCKIIDLHDKVNEGVFSHVPSLFGLNNELKTKQPKRFFKEVVEPIEEARKEHGIYPTTIIDPDDIKLVVKNRKLEIKSLRLSPEVSNFTDRTWVDIGNGYEILYSEDNKALIIERDEAKGELIDKEEWHLLEMDTKSNLTKKLQTFNSLSGAFKIADEYADSKKYNKQFLEKNEWQTKGVTEKQLNFFNKFFIYKNGFSKFKLLEDRYEDSGVRHVFWKETGEVLDCGTASKILSDFFSNKK